MTNLEQSRARILDACFVKLTFSLIVTFYLTKPLNGTKKSLPQLSYYCFEYRCWFFEKTCWHQQNEVLVLKDIFSETAYVYLPSKFTLQTIFQRILLPSIWPISQTNYTIHIMQNCVQLKETCFMKTLKPIFLSPIPIYNSCFKIFLLAFLFYASKLFFHITMQYILLFQVHLNYQMKRTFHNVIKIFNLISNWI